MKEFWVYTLMRLALFVGSFVLIFFVWWFVKGDVPIFWVVVLAFVASGLASYFLLVRQREKFAVKVEGRAARMAQKIEEQRAKEDVD